MSFQPFYSCDKKRYFRQESANLTRLPRGVNNTIDTIAITRLPAVQKMRVSRAGCAQTFWHLTELLFQPASGLVGLVGSFFDLFLTSMVSCGGVGLRSEA
jgi:hypothetical protein